MTGFRFSLLVLVLLASTFASAKASAQAPLTFAYRGELIDDTNTPISGVFPLTFQLYRQQDASDAFWSETHWVAVIEGQYDVLLGRQTTLEQEWDGQAVFIAVELGDLGEFLRHAYTPNVLPEPPTRDEAIAALDVTFADVADRALFAVEADIADSCDTIGGMTLEELDRYEEVLEQIAELEAQVSRATGAQLGSRTTTLERVGGSGGNPYSRSCPPGHVITGVRGGAGSLIDSIEIVCSPLQ
jgi:hypothetical protein